MTPSKNVFLSLPWNFSFVGIYPVCLLVLKLAPAKHVTNEFSSKYKYEKLADLVHVIDQV